MARKSPVVVVVLPWLALLWTAGCGSGAVDITAVSHDGQTLHFSDVGCAVTYTGADSATNRPPNAIDITCPAALRSPHSNPTLHISTPLVTKAGPLPLMDPRFQTPGYQLGQFVVITLVRDGQIVTCDPLQGAGAIQYSAVPVYGTAGRLAGQFSPDAALSHCLTAGQADDPSAPLQLQGTFDLSVPVGG